MRIILFGGTFNPIHNGHIEAARLAMEKIGAKKVIFVPNFDSFENKDNLDYVSPFDRYKMVYEVIKNVPKFEIDNFEIMKGRRCYTIETIKYLRDKYFEDDIYLLMGEDQLLNFHKWKNYEEIMELATIICIKRSNHIIDKSNFCIHDFIFIDNDFNTISSSNIKESLITRNLPYKALKYINDNGLYAKTRLSHFLSPSRFDHSVRVAKLAYDLMLLFDKENAIKGWVAGLYHDICKEFDKENIEMIAYGKYDLPVAPSWKVLHGPVGAKMLKDMFHFDDEMILNAIENHTIPNSDRSKLTILDKVLFCSDKIEPKRTEKDLVNIDKIRRVAMKDIHAAFDMILETLDKMYNTKGNEV